MRAPVVRPGGRVAGRVALKRSKGFGFEPSQGRAWINAGQYFAPVEEALWEYQIGGYQVLEKWLKDRRGRSLSYEEIGTYCRIATALALTMQIQKELDKLYPAVAASVMDLVLAD